MNVSLSRPPIGTSDLPLKFQNRDRRYLLHVPTGVQADKRLPLVLLFHGGSQTPEQMEQMTGFSDLADREQFLVAYPAGVQRNWADGRGTTPPEQIGIDDVGFTRAVIADIERRAKMVDPRRIYAAGPSNGGIFVNRLGCEMADTLAAIGPVIGAIAERLAHNCHPAAPISVIGIQSVTDPLVPFEGGEEGGRKHLGRGGAVAGARATQDLWSSLDGCRGSPVSMVLPVRVNDGTSVTKRSYEYCRAGAEVVWYEIQGGGHRWPPHQLPPLSEAIVQRTLGVSSQNIDATQTLWTFFREHPKFLPNRFM